jgi:hypothetical protein
LEPGETTTLDLSVNLARRTGVQNFTCTLLTTDAVSPRWTYSVKVRTVLRVAASPCYVTFGELKRGEIAEREILLQLHSNVGEGDCALGSVETPSGIEIIEHSSTRATLEKDGLVEVQKKLMLRVRPGEDAGPASANVVFNVATQDGEPCSEVLRVNWSVAAPIEITPRKVSFGSVQRSTGIQRLTVRLRSEEGAAFSVVNIKSEKDASGFTYEYERQPKTEHDMAVVLDVAQLQRTVFDTLILELDHPRAKQLRLPLWVFLKEQDQTVSRE